MTIYTLLIILSSLVIFSYIFDLVASKTRLPSVLLLLLLGIGLRVVVDVFNIRTFNFTEILPYLGTVGLILIVFEGALELKYESDKNKLIKSAFFSALCVLVATCLIITGVIYYISKQSFYICFANSIPFAVISSAIAIPSAGALSKKSKEFIVYESSFSDILGVIIANFTLTNPNLTLGSFANLGLTTGLILIISAISCVFLLYILGRIQHHIKFFLIIAILILLYAIGQSYHLPALIIILSFGLFFNNADAFQNAYFRSIFLYKNLQSDLQQLFQLSAESAFIVRTFFFVIFGFTINVYELYDSRLLLNGVLFLAIIFVIRYIYLAVTKHEDIFPITYVAPRGLISILLYINLPIEIRIPEIGTAILFVVVLGSSIIMTLGILLSGKKPPMVEEQLHG